MVIPRGQPTRAELRQRVEELQRELEEAKARQEDGGDAELISELREDLRGAKDTAEQDAERLWQELEHMRQEADNLQDSAGSRARRNRTWRGPRRSPLLELRDEADSLQWRLEQATRDNEVLVVRAKEAVRKELQEQHANELAVREEVIALRSSLEGAIPRRAKARSTPSLRSVDAGPKPTSQQKPVARLGQTRATKQVRQTLLRPRWPFHPYRNLAATSQTGMRLIGGCKDCCAMLS